MLAQHFLAQFSAAMNKPVKRLSPAAGQKLLSHHWPGNVRELRNVIERGVILEATDEVQPRNVPDFTHETGLRKTEAPGLPVNQALDECLADYERQLIQAALERNHYSLGKTAEKLKVTRHALRYRMQRLNLSLGTDTESDSPPGKEPEDPRAP